MSANVSVRCSMCMCRVKSPKCGVPYVMCCVCSAEVKVCVVYVMCVLCVSCVILHGAVMCEVSTEPQCACVCVVCERERERLR